MIDPRFIMQTKTTLQRACGLPASVRRSRGVLGRALAALCLATCAIFAIPSAGHAALTGDTVIFDNISVGPWGVPTVSGDELNFTPTDFRATQPGGPGVDFASGIVELDIWAMEGYQITGIRLDEEGDSFILGNGRTVVDGTVTAGTAATALAFPVTGNEFVGPGGFGFDNPLWAAEAAIDLSASPVAHLHVSLENELVAVAPGVLDLADVNKALAMLQVSTGIVAVPEPLSAGLVGSAALLLWLRRRVATA